MSKRNYAALLWHAVFLSVTVTFTEINTILPAMILKVGGNEFHIGILTAIMVGVPLVAQLFFAGFLHARQRKKSYLLIGISVRITSLGMIALTIAGIRQMSFALALIIIYLELLLFTLGGAFAGISYLDILGKSFSGDVRKRFFLRKQTVSSLGILASAIIARIILSGFDYPQHYIILFAAAAVILLIASGGFWVIREENSGESAKTVTLYETIRAIPKMISNDRTLGFYILVNNLLSYGIVLLPFYTALARKQYSLDSGLVGNLLLLQILGMVISSFLWPALVKKRGFKGILVYRALLAAVLPLIALTVSSLLPVQAYLFIFILAGSAMGAQKMTNEAVLVEISTDENRALYTGIIGTLNLTVALFPLIIGILIQGTGFVPVFAAGSLFALISLFYIRRMACPVDRA